MANLLWLRNEGCSGTTMSFVNDEAPTGRPVRVLVVEDEPLIAMDHRAVIEELGGEVVAMVETGESALVAAEIFRPDVVVMDVHLRGGTDGIEAARAIRERVGTRVVFVTGDGDPRTCARMSAFAGEKPVLKPVSVGALYDAIVRACRLSEAPVHAPERMVILCDGTFP